VLGSGGLMSRRVQMIGQRLNPIDLLGRLFFLRIVIRDLKFISFPDMGPRRSIFKIIITIRRGRHKIRLGLMNNFGSAKPAKITFPGIDLSAIAALNHFNLPLPNHWKLSKIL
jgi:hypothetical protein